MPLLLSKTIGQPVRVQWMRHDEHGWDPKGPQQLLDVRAALDAGGRIVVVGDRDVGPQRRARRACAALGRRREACRRSTAPAPAPSRRTAIRPTPADNVRVVAHLIKDTPLQLSNLRAPGKIANVFAVEGFTDELAAAAGVDAG